MIFGDSAINKQHVRRFQLREHSASVTIRVEYVFKEDYPPLISFAKEDIEKAREELKRLDRELNGAEQ